MEITDSELIDRIACRDVAAFATFYDRHSPGIYALLRRILGESTGADDVLQEAFWRIWERARQYDPARGSVRTWLFLVARSRAIEYRRRNPAPHGLTSSEGVEPAVVTDPSRGLEREETQTRLMSALAELPAEYSALLELAFFEGLSHSRISERLGLSLGTVKTRIRSGLIRLRSRLKTDMDRTP